MQSATQQLEQPGAQPRTAAPESESSPAERHLFCPWHFVAATVSIPLAVLDSKRLSPTAKLVWVTLARYCHAKNYTYPKVRTLAGRLGISKNTVLAAISQLVRENFLYRIRRGRKLSNLYEFRLDPHFLPAEPPPPGNRPQVPPAQADRPAEVKSKNWTSVKSKNWTSTQSHHHQRSTEGHFPDSEAVPPSPPKRSSAPPERHTHPGQTQTEKGEVKSPREAEAELVQLVQKRTGEPFPQHVLAEIQLSLTRQRVPLAEFVLRLKPHLENARLKNPVGFLRVFARKFNQLTRAVDLVAIQRPRCHECGFPLGKGGKEQAGKIVPCPTCQAYQRELGRRR